MKLMNIQSWCVRSGLNIQNCNIFCVLLCLFRLCCSETPTATCGRSSSTLCWTCRTASLCRVSGASAANWRPSCSRTIAANCPRSRAAWWFCCWRAARRLGDDDNAAWEPEEDLLHFTSVSIWNFKVTGGGIWATDQNLYIKNVIIFCCFFKICFYLHPNCLTSGRDNFSLVKNKISVEVSEIIFIWSAQIPVIIWFNCFLSRVCDVTYCS